MSRPEAERVLVVPGDDPAAVRLALRAVRDDATARRVEAHVEILVDESDDAAEARDALDDVALTDAVTVAITVAADPVAVALTRAASGDLTRAFVAADADVPDLSVPVERFGEPRSARPRPLRRSPTRGGLMLAFLLSYAFYLLLGDPTDSFDVVTGAATAALVAAALSSVAVDPAEAVAGTAASAVRATVFLPYLVWQIAVATVDVAVVVLRPSLPIDPRIVAYDLGPTGRFERAVLANAVTLTPGTVAVDVTPDRLRVHALTARSRRSLESGDLARAVAWVFHGRTDG